MRLIDADAFKKILSEHEMEHDKRRSFDDYAWGASNAYEHASDLLDEMPTVERPHGEWVPCSERLPEEYHTYLVTKLDPNPSKSTFTTLAYFYTEETGWDIDDVIAWMPFPKPYRKEGDMDG